jgi:hypothetical protein
VVGTKEKEKEKEEGMGRGKGSQGRPPFNFITTICVKPLEEETFKGGTVYVQV